MNRQCKSRFNIHAYRKEVSMDTADSTPQIIPDESACSARENGEEKISRTICLNVSHNEALKTLAKKRAIAGREPSHSLLIAEALQGYLIEQGVLGQPQLNG